jgi:hypothetical protein
MLLKQIFLNGNLLYKILFLELNFQIDPTVATTMQCPARLESQPEDHHIRQILQEGQPCKNIRMKTLNIIITRQILIELTVNANCPE